MKKILYSANTDRHINLCHIPYLKDLKDKGYITHVVTNTNYNIDYCDKKIKIPISRTPLKLGNIKAIFRLRKIVLKEKYDLVITNTPMGAFVTRLACIKARKKYNTKVIYIAHGFHFYKGARLFNWLIYYPVEKILSKYTDTIITINNEDYEFALKKFKNCEIKLINGIGFNEDKFNNKLKKEEIKSLKEKLNINNNDYIISYIAEISKRKRQKYLIKTFSKINDKNIKLLLVGDNILGDKVPKLIKKYNLENNIIMIPFNDEISQILDITDLVISVSMQEGLPLNIMEAMYKNKDILVTDCRGNSDLIKNNVNGIVVPINDSKSLIAGILSFKNKLFKSKVSNKLLSKKYSIKNIKKQYENIFENVLRSQK